MFELDPGAPNIFPSKYRQVSVSHAAVDLDEESLSAHFIGLDAYMRTRFIVVRDGDSCALIEVVTRASDELFSPIEAVRLLAGPESCSYVVDPEIDVGIAPQFVGLAERCDPGVRCIVVEGRYSHVSFLLNPQPLWINLLDIVPPAPSKLADQAQRLLDVGEDLPPIGLRVEPVDSLSLLASSSEPTAGHVLMPCRTTAPEAMPSGEVGAKAAGDAGAGGSESAAQPGPRLSFLDQRPTNDPDWILLGCTRSSQIHESFYGYRPTAVDTCPRQFLNAERDADGPTLTRCCLLQHGQEERDRAVLVPWGSSLAEVRDAIAKIVEIEGFVWTPT